jgi:hypothetical protein
MKTRNWIETSIKQSSWRAQHYARYLSGLCRLAAKRIKQDRHLVVTSISVYGSDLWHKSGVRMCGCTYIYINFVPTIVGIADTPN